MPQATDKLRARMNELFGSPTSDEGPITFLEKSGYKLNTEHCWVKSGVTELWEMTRDEFTCMCFLVDEWDYGGLGVE